MSEFVRFDPLLHGVLTDAGQWGVRGSAADVAARSLVDGEFRQRFRDAQQNVFDFSNRDAQLLFCRIASSGAVQQFSERRDFFVRRSSLLSSAHVFRFSPLFSFAQLLVEKNRNDVGYRPLPFNNMFVECFLEFGGVTVNGVHLLKVYCDDVGTQFYQDVDGVAPPPTHTREGVSVFFTGLDKDSVAYYNYFNLTNDVFREAKDESRYSCPLCNLPLSGLGGEEFVCAAPMCVSSQVKRFGGQVLFDLKVPAVKKSFRSLSLRDVWRIEALVGEFVSNFLDFLTNPEVRVEVCLSESERLSRNEKRVRKGKGLLPPISVVSVRGHLQKVVGGLSSQFGSVSEAREASWVRGHFFRFWNRERWSRLYGLIAKCRSPAERTAVLSGLGRVDDDGLLLPLSQQYQFDEQYGVIKVWKMPYLRNEGGLERPHVMVVGR